MKSRTNLKRRFYLYNCKREIVLNRASMAQIAKYLKYKSVNTVRSYVLLGKKDLRNQSTNEVFYIEPLTFE